MRLLHYSAHPVTLPLIDTTMRLKPEAVKPVGLWVSVEGEYDWHWWCHAEGYALDRFRYETEVKLAADHRVLITPFPEHIEESYRVGGDTYRRDYINWQKVAEKWDGVIITPYSWESMMSVWFYYGWDCASGCIWNPRAIESISVRELAQPVLS